MRVPLLIGAMLAHLGLGLPAVAGTESWQDFTLPGTDFVVSMPGKPKVMDDGVDREGVATKTAQLKLGAVEFSVTHTVYPSGYVSRGTAVIDLLNSARDSLAATVSGTLASERRFALGPTHGSEFVIAVPPTPGDPQVQSATVRLYVRVVGATVILDQCVATGPRGSDADRQAQRFLESARFAQG
jgi:hypothetical protein